MRTQTVTYPSINYVDRDQRVTAKPGHHYTKRQEKKFRTLFNPIVFRALYCRIFLCDELREPLLTVNSFRQLLKTRLFAEYWCIQRIRGITHYALYTFTYLLTFFCSSQCKFKIPVRQQKFILCSYYKINKGVAYCVSFHFSYSSKLFLHFM